MIDQAAVSRLINALHSLAGRDEGGYKQVWADGNIEKFVTFYALPKDMLNFTSLKKLDYWFKSWEVVTEARSTLRDLENVRSVLRALSDSLENTVTEMKKHIRPFEIGKGLASLPDEMLSEIFEHVSEEPSYEYLERSKKNLLLVCQRFRRTAINTPRLWSRISYSAKISYVRTCLKRSKSVGLTITLDLPMILNRDFASVTDRVLSYLDAVAPHSKRWEHLDMRIGSLDLASRTKICQSSFLQDLQLPALYKLCLRFGGPGRHPETAHATESDVRHVYKSWHLPLLQHLEVDFIPHLLISPSLSYVDLSHTYVNAIHYTHLQQFLVKLPALEELHLTVRENENGELQLIQHNPAMELRSLKVLDIDAQACGSDFPPFMATLRPSMLRKLHIRLRAPDSARGLESYVDKFFPHESYPFLEDLTLRLYARKGDDLTTFVLPFRKLQGLRSLTLEAPPSMAPFLPSPISKQAHSLPALRKLKMLNCTHEHCDWLETLQELQSNGGLWDGFEELVIGRMFDDEDKRYIEAVYHGKSVRWR